MHSNEIQEKIYEWAVNKNFNAPYGVLKSSHTSKKGKKYLTVTFGRSRTLDASVDIYNSKFMMLRTSRREHDGVYKSFEELMNILVKL